MAGFKRKKICINFDKSDTSSFQSYVVHSRCLPAGKVYERNKPRKVESPTWEMRSAYPLRENIWEYLNEDKSVANFNCSSKRRTRPLCKQTAGDAAENNKMWFVLLLLLAVAAVVTYSRLSDFIAQSKFITKVVPKTRLISLLNMEQSVEEECCAVVKSLSASLLKAEQSLRNTQRIRRMMIITSRGSKTVPDRYESEILLGNFDNNPFSRERQIKYAPSSPYERDYIEDATVMRGSGTREWGGRVALWGVLPLWRASPPPSTVLARRRPVPSDCWPFSGSRGEMIIELGQTEDVSCISIEHIKPDMAKSAPKNFVLYGILENGTLVTSIEAEYRSHGPARQFFQTTPINTPLQRMIFKVLSNQGNTKYTCVYRVHFYRNVKTDTHK